jgi:hypothetical protein
MRVLLLLSPREVHRDSNLATYTALKSQVLDLTWCSGSAFELYRTLPKGNMYLEPVDLETFKKYPPPKPFATDAFDVAIVDQSLDLTQDQSPALIGGGIANRSLDFQGRERPSVLAQELTRIGIVCIGTSRNGVCLDELAQFGGAVLTCPLERLPEKLPDLMREAKRLVEDNRPGGNLKALTLRQPWAWSIFHTGKDVENRAWPAKVRGTIAIHAAETQPDGIYENSKKYMRSILHKLGIKGLRIPSYERLDKGAIIGLVDIVDCVRESDSTWFEGPIGYKLANPRLLPRPIPCEGKRRFFAVSSEVEAQIHEMLSGA